MPFTIKSPDLDVLFPSPHKLMMAEKRIIESEIEKAKSLKSGQLPPRQLFPALPRQVSYDQTSTFTSPSAANFVFLNNTSINKTFRLTTKTSEEVGVGEVTEPQVSAKFPHSPIHHYTSIYGALLFSVSPVRCTCIIKYGAVRKFFPSFYPACILSQKKRRLSQT